MAQHISVGFCRASWPLFVLCPRTPFVAGNGDCRMPAYAGAVCGVLPWAVYLSSAVGLPLRRRVVLLGGITPYRRA